MEKLTLFKNCDVVIYNGDDEFVSNCVAKSIDVYKRQVFNAWLHTTILSVKDAKI